MTSPATAPAGLGRNWLKFRFLKFRKSPLDTIYNTIGVDYAETRKPDPRLAALIHASLKGLESILNVGAGAGSYEPADKSLVALEPSSIMISQRPAGAAPCVGGEVENLPFADNSFDAAMALLTLHHWRDIWQGLSELKRVVRKRIVIHTHNWDTAVMGGFWLTNDYIPEIIDRDARRFPKIEDIAAEFRSVRVIKVLIPHDCSDGFLCAYWRRPEAYLDDQVRKGISSFQQISQPVVAEGLAKLKADLESGRWAERYAELLDKEEIDLGYRLIVAENW